MQQLSLFGNGPPPRRDAVFFGLQPPPPARTEIFQTGRRFKTEHALIGPEMADHTLHLSLHGLAASSDEAAWVLIEACRAMETVATSAFELRFDRVISWRGTPHKRPLVLLPDAPSAVVLTGLWFDIGAALHGAGLPASTKFEPHITLGRYPTTLPEMPVQPITWTADAFHLIWSHYGQGQHSQLHRVPLPSADQTLGL